MQQRRTALGSVKRLLHVSMHPSVGDAARRVGEQREAAAARRTGVADIHRLRTVSAKQSISAAPERLSG